MDDTIYRQEAIKTFCERCGNLGEPCDGCNDIPLLYSLPSAQQWIPCSERMPTKPGRYLATVEVLGSRSRVETTLFDGDDFWENVRAWMPLPEPYKEKT